MATTALKFSMLFNFQGSGFSENWWWTGSPPSPGQNINTGAFLALATARNRITASSVLLVGTRLSDPLNPRQTYNNFVAAPFSSGDPPDIPTSSWVCQVKGIGNVGSRELFIRGLPDDQIVWQANQQTFAPQGALNQFITAYTKQLTSNPWALQTIQSKKAAGGAALPISTITPNSANAGVNCVGAAAFTFTGTIIVSGFKKPLSFLNGHYLPGSGYTIGSGGILVLNNKPLNTLLAAGYMGGSAFVRPQVLNYVGIQSLQLQFPRERRVGRAFFVARGRRPARR